MGENNQTLAIEEVIKNITEKLNIKNKDELKSLLNLCEIGFGTKADYVFGKELHKIRELSKQSSGLGYSFSVNDYIRTKLNHMNDI
jgi:hypothetical protein